MGYSKGLHPLAKGVYAYLSPDGSWGLNNTGLILDGGKSLLVDTLFDLASTREMLDEMAAADPAASSIDTLVITHGNGDHFYGSELVKATDVIATEACAQEMAASPPSMLANLLKEAPGMGELGRFLLHCLGRFHFEGICPPPPTRMFSERLELTVGGKPVELIEAGPAHTRGDLIVHLPQDRILFAGDLLFIGGTPIMWAGPVGNWIAACDLMLALDVDAIVPGHGPVTDKAGVKAVRDYWTFLEAEAHKRWQTGMSAEEAAADISLGRYAELTDTERTVVNLHTLYREFGNDNAPADPVVLFRSMAEYWMKSRRFPPAER